MLDEWIEQRSRVYIQPAQHSQEPREPRRFLTTTGELIPLTEGVIEEIQQVVNAYLRGETPPDYVPKLESPDGKLEPISAESFEELIAVIRQDAAQRSVTNHLLKEFPPVPVQPRKHELEWFDTHDGGLPPITVEDASENGTNGSGPPPDVVDAEWVMEVSQRPRRGPRRPRQRRQQKKAGAGWALRAVIAVALVAVLAVAVALALGLIELPLPPAPGLAVTAEALVGEGGPPGDDPQMPAPNPPADEGAASALPAVPAVPASPEPTGRIAFASDEDGDFDIYVLDLSTGEITRLTDNDAADRTPAWSPDGSRLIYVSDEAGDDDLYVIDADGGRPLQVTHSTEHDRAPAWSPDGSQVAFARETANGSDVMTFNTACISNPEGCESGLRTLVGGGYDREPAWSADGRRLALSTAAFPGLPTAIGVLKPGDDEVRPLVGTGLTDFSPAWSPDGRWIAFASNRSGDYDLWAMSPDGGAVVQITRSTTVEVQPKWSPDGAFIVFASDRRAGTDFDLYVLDARCLDTNPETCEDSVIALTDGPDDALDPAWVH